MWVHCHGDILLRFLGMEAASPQERWGWGLGRAGRDRQLQRTGASIAH